MKCKNCGTELKENALYCHICGKKVEDNWICPKCGKKSDEEQIFVQTVELKLVLNHF